MTKVMIGIPTQDYVHIHFTSALVAMVKESDLAITIATGRGSNICQNRNLLVHMAVKDKPDYLMFIDNDLSFPPFALDRMVKFAETKNLDILGCNYLFKTPPHQIMVVTKNREEQTLQGIDEVDRLPTGMMLIRTSILEKLPQPYFMYQPELDNNGLQTVGTEDYQFCDKLRAQGIKIFMDSDLSFGLVHWGSPLGVKWITEPPGYQYISEPLNYKEH